MTIEHNHETSKRRPINLTISQDVISEAKKLSLNTSKAAEYGILEAIKQEKEKLWLKKNRAAVEAHNNRVEKNGTYIKPVWIEE
ncbi:hypothetical protein EZY14_007535 [Kordia sp. TARA_039_SRF]|nr:hypothetical protein EZY14_007535 [Kordia sp. TARA_039_SRF]